MVPMVRDVDELFDHEFDVLVVGGGIAGACAAWDAASRGMRTALVEAHDFASGASSNNLKLVHGGLRYVKRLELRTARAAVRERRTWLRMAPHLVETVPILVPAYHKSIQNPTLIRLLLSASDALARDRNDGVAEEHRIPGGRILSRAETVGLAPQLDDRRLAGGALFHDGRIRNTERLVLEILRAAVYAGASVANYVRCDGIAVKNGAVVGARLTDRHGQRSGELRARAVVIAAGADAPAVLARLVPGAAPPADAYSLAMNIVIPATGLETAITLPSRPAPGQPPRQLLWVPWRGVEIIGTYHGDIVSPSSRPVPDGPEVDRFLAEVNRSAPGLPLRAEDVRLVHAGSLPLVGGTGRADHRLLRRHRIIDHADAGAAGLVSIITVKYTTARLAAEEALDAVQRHLGHAFGPCLTADSLLPTVPADAGALRASVRVQYGERLADDVIDHLVHTYGSGVGRVLAHLDERADGHVRVETDSPVIHAELIHGVRDEMAHTVADLVRRRTELGARGVSDNAVLARIAHVLDHELGRHRVTLD